MWYPAAMPEDLAVRMEGGKDRPDPEIVEMARKLLKNPGELVQRAEEFVRANNRAKEFIEGSGELVCDGFTVYASGRFAVEFSLTNWPDAMISVPFEEGAPCDVVLGD
jgi:hypothetical protein